MLIGERAIVRLYVEVYFDHLDPASWFQDPSRSQALADECLNEGRLLWLQPFTLLGIFAPDDVTNVGWPSVTVNAGRKESRVNKIEVVRRECEWSIQVINLHDTSSATVLPWQSLNKTGQPKMSLEADATACKGLDNLLHNGFIERLKGGSYLPEATSFQAHRPGSCAGQCLHQ